MQGTVYPCAYREHAHIRKPAICYRRFIPVYTGNILCLPKMHIVYAVYPCAYREHSLFAQNANIVRGLSLCIQGTSNRALSPSCFFRFIPVHTGNIFILKNIKWRVTVYPCAYREHIGHRTNHIAIIGLSLCIQGTFLLLFHL